MTRRVSPVLEAGPFTTGQAWDLGLTPAQLRGSRFARLFPRVYVDTRIRMTFPLWCQAALLTAPAGSAICGIAALRLKDFDLPQRMEKVRHIDVLMPRDMHWQAPAGIRVRRTRRAWVRDSVMLASPGIVFTLLGLDPWSLAELVQVGDRMTERRNPWTTPGELVAAVERCANQRGRARLSRAVRLVRAGTDSIPETTLRLVLIKAGLPEPVVNFPVREGAGHRLMYIDLSYPEAKVAIEYDGEGHWRSDSIRRDDYARQRALESLGWLVIRATAHDLVHPHGLIDAIRQALTNPTRANAR